MSTDTTVNSTPTLQATATLNGVTTTMDTAQLTIYNPNLLVILGPVGLAAFTTGMYQYTLPLGTLKMPGTWSGVWYFQSGQQSLQTTKPFTVGP